ncbi:MAG: restriction endonuclease-like protein [Oscillospiraceae bacterium]|nr:restriction endonuclease-like protein [Oscillospiraceae bacterium]
MDLLPTGSDELVYIRTDKVNLTIKGPAAHPSFQGVEYREGDSEFKLSCSEEYELSLKGCADAGATMVVGSVFSGIYPVAPLFYEQQRYEIVIESNGDYEIAFWHDNLNIRSKVTRVGRNSRILSGVINFGNEIGLSDLIVKVDGSNYLRLTIEVFPTKISYKDDYKAIVEDVTREVYGLVFDFLKKTYLGYRQSERVISSPVEFFAVIRQIFGDFMKAADMILAQPHHLLETTHELLPSHKIKRIDSRSLRWIEKHPDQAKVSADRVLVARTLAVKKQITYDTKENRLTKYILQTTAKKLQSFKRNYLNLQRAEDAAVVNLIDDMIRSLSRRSNASFLADVGPHESSAGMSLVFSMAPGYRDLYKYYLMLLHGLSITGDVFNISIKDLAVLYEYWCFIKLNSLMKDRYELVSQDIVMVQGNGLYVSLVKGSRSCVKYRNPVNGELITLSYNPKETELPTGTQRPDNVLNLRKKGADMEYEYVFDAKYRINPALPGTDYYETISHKPGPEVGDINTMHRYRDAIVYQNGGSPYERTMFGAYVLFPYSDEAEYQKHRFFKSISKVNIGGLPFLPSAMSLVSQMLDDLISDSPESAFERATLPRGIEDKLQKLDWTTRDVLIGDLRSVSQFDVCFEHKFYYIPVSQVKDENLPIRYVALYQSNRLFGVGSGIRYYGEVTSCRRVRRREIHYLPKASDEFYYYLEIKEWKPLPKPIAIKERAMGRQFTNMFLLKHSSEAPELGIRSEAEYRLFSELKRALNSTEINDDGTDIGFVFGDAMIAFEDGKIRVYRDKRVSAEYEIQDFTRAPNAVFRSLQQSLS